MVEWPDGFRFHYWVSDEDAMLIPGRYKHVLCWSRNDPSFRPGNEAYAVTMVASEVTCPECLEWLHA